MFDSFNHIDVIGIYEETQDIIKTYGDSQIF